MRERRVPRHIATIVVEPGSGIQMSLSTPRLLKPRMYRMNLPKTLKGQITTRSGRGHIYSVVFPVNRNGVRRIFEFEEGDAKQSSG